MSLTVICLWRCVTPTPNCYQHNLDGLELWGVVSVHGMAYLYICEGVIKAKWYIQFGTTYATRSHKNPSEALW